jgi:hypothetical protein
MRALESDDYECIVFDYLLYKVLWHSLRCKAKGGGVAKKLIAAILVFISLYILRPWDHA